MRLFSSIRAFPPPVSVVLFAGLVGLGLLGAGCSSNPTPKADAASQETPTRADEAASSEPAHEEEEHAELAVSMSWMQRWTHKAALAVNAENKELSDFYLHELEETVETIQEETPTYEGHEVGTLTEQILVPSLDSLDAAVDAGDWSAARERLAGVARSCNQCHAATDHGFVRIRLDSLANPFAQSFAP